MALKFYKCETCGNIVCKIEDHGTPLTCCNHQMVELRPESTDGALEKHVPVCENINNNICVKVGSMPHIMEPSHHIKFIVLETNTGFFLKYLDVNKDASACFRLFKDEEVTAMYELCNLHGLYVAYPERS